MSIIWIIIRFRLQKNIKNTFLSSTPGQIRTVDLRLRKPLVNSMISKTYGDLDPIWAQLNRYAKELLRRVADGEVLSLSEIRSFAEAVLQSQPVALAQAVLEADREFVITYAVELAASLIVSEVAVEEDLGS